MNILHIITSFTTNTQSHRRLAFKNSPDTLDDLFNRPASEPHTRLSQTWKCPQWECSLHAGVCVCLCVIVYMCVFVHWPCRPEETDASRVAGVYTRPKHETQTAASREVIAQQCSQKQEDNNNCHMPSLSAFHQTYTCCYTLFENGNSSELLLMYLIFSVA